MRIKNFIVLLVGAVFLAQASLGDVESDAKQFIQNLGDEAIKILKQKKGQQWTKNKFDSLFKRNFALNTIGKQVMGKYWRFASQSQKNEFLELFQQYTLDTYTSRLREYGKEKFEVTGAEQRTEVAIFVDSKVIQANGRPLFLKWLVLKGKNGDFRIGDVYIEGLSQLKNQREEYGAVIRKHSRGLSKEGVQEGIDGLLHELREFVK